MGVKHFYIVRHGETDFNLKGIIQGRGIDADLNETGRTQAARFFEKYQDLPFDRIFTSSLKRTHQSVAGFIGKGIPHEIMSGLDELSWGIYDGMFPTEKLKPGIRRILRKWDEGLSHAKAFGGESPDEVAVRLRTSLAHIVKAEGSNFLISTHGRSMRILLCEMFKLPVSEMSKYGHNNLCLYQIDYYEETQSFEMKLENDTSHLVKVVE